MGLFKSEHFSKKRGGSFLLTLEASKGDVILICILILTTQSHSTGGTCARFPLKIAPLFIMAHYVDNCQAALEVRALSNRTEMVILKQYTFQRKYSSTLNSITEEGQERRDEVRIVPCLELGHFICLLSSTCRKRCSQLRTV